MLTFWKSNHQIPWVVLWIRLESLPTGLLVLTTFTDLCVVNTHSTILFCIEIGLDY